MFDRNKYNKEWRERNKEKVKAYGRKFRRNHPEVQKAWRDQNPEKVKAYGRKQSKKYRAKMYAWLYEYKSGKPCQDCGQVFPPVCLDFDHRDPSTKAGCVGHLVVRTMKMLQDEIAKCDLICANCHRIRTALRDDFRGSSRVAKLKDEDAQS